MHLCELPQAVGGTDVLRGNIQLEGGRCAAKRPRGSTEIRYHGERGTMMSGGYQPGTTLQRAFGAACCAAGRESTQESMCREGWHGPLWCGEEDVDEEDFNPSSAWVCRTQA